MKLDKLLIANRGEISVRIAATAGRLGLRTVAVHAEDDARCLHVRRADEAVPLTGTGANAYMDLEQLIEAARSTGCSALHPGYGFAAESAELARRCEAAGIRFVGPSSQTLALLGDKTAARRLAAERGVPVLEGTAAATSLEDARSFVESLGPGASVMLKACAGGGGRGIRPVASLEELDAAFRRCASEAAAAFGSDALYVERFAPRVRHIEVQVVGDRAGHVTHLWERECSLQRRRQKLVEIAPAPSLAEDTRQRLIDCSLAMATAAHYGGLGTFEFLVETRAERPAFWFIEANPRLQVEHTVTEAVTGFDLVELQLRIADGEALEAFGLGSAVPPRPHGFAVQARINAEQGRNEGTGPARAPRIERFEPPFGPGVRVDSCLYTGYTPPAAYDPLLAKLIVHDPSADARGAIGAAYRALCELRISGLPTNLALLQSLFLRPELAAGDVHTRYVDEHTDELEQAFKNHPKRYFDDAPIETAGSVGARIGPADPLAVLEHGKTTARHAAPYERSHPTDDDGLLTIRSAMQGTIVEIEVREGEAVQRGDALLVMESMKMEHVIGADHDGNVRTVAVALGDTVYEGYPLIRIEPAHEDLERAEPAPTDDRERIRPDLQEASDRHAIGLDAARPDAVARRRATDQRTTRENIDDLCDPGSFVEYGSLVIAAQRRRRSIEDLIRNTPADGMVAGIGTINANRFGEGRTRCVVMSYDYTVLAGTQGLQNHRKKDRMLEIADRSRLPVVLFAEGGGGRPGDTDSPGGSGLDCLAFQYFADLSGLVPLVGINSGRCFAGNAALLGCCDVVIAAANSNIGMGGPAMVEGGGLGVYRPEEIGPVDVQVPNGVIDILVADEADAVRTAKKYLSYFQGSFDEWTAKDPRLLRSIVPENRLRVYDVRDVIDTLADADSVLELRPHFGHGMVTALGRIEGRPIGIIANNPKHLSGAIDSHGADKAARFMMLCDAFDLPILFLCDTPGIMVGPEIERTALVRHAARMFVVGASITVPFFTIVLRKSYGLGAMAMAGGGFKATLFSVAWPTGEFGGMGLEGAVKLGFRKELEAVENPDERRRLFDEMVEKMYEHGKAVNTASHFEIDDVIDPAQSRRWIMTALEASPTPAPRPGKKRPCIDPW